MCMYLHDCTCLGFVCYINREPIEFSDPISPICLPEQHEEFEAGLKCYTTGWGDLMGRAACLCQFNNLHTSCIAHIALLSKLVAKRVFEFLNALFHHYKFRQSAYYIENTCEENFKTCLSAGGESPNTLQQVMVPIIGRDTCNKENWYGGELTENMLCAGYEEGGRDSCQVM